MAEEAASEAQETQETVDTETQATTEETQAEQGAEAGVDWGEVRKAIKDEKLRSHAERFVDLDSLVKGNLELRQKMSNAIVKPGKDASEEDIKSYRKALGVPESPDKYEFEGIKVDEADEQMKNAVDHWKNVFYENNVPADVANKLTQAQQEIVQQVQEQQNQMDEKHAQEAEESLRKTWGSDYDTNREYATRAAQDLFGEDFESVRNMEDKSGRYIMDKPAFMKMLARVGREMGEGRLGPVATHDEVSSIQEQALEITEKYHAAMDRGDMSEAKRLDKQAKALWEKVPSRQSKDFMRV